MMRSRFVIPLSLVGAFTLAADAQAEDRSFDAGGLIIPMDLEYQADGLYQAYGLVFQLLRQGVTVYWVIDPDKVWHDAPCDTEGDECAWDCGEEGSGIKCPYPTGSPDFYVGAEVVWDDQGGAAGATISNHGYRGGPFVIDAADAGAARPIIDAWNDPDLWSDNDWAERSEFNVVTVHEASSPFTGYVKKELVAAPTIAVFADGNEDIATGYLRTAGIKQSSGAEFPDGTCGDDDCGPGTGNPDLLTVPSIMGDMGTCDEPDYDHKNGALFTEDGLPAYCQIMSMHWDVKDREKVECGGGDCPDTPEDCAGVPITYHGHEVVAEVRSFLSYPTHFFAECQAVNAYENTVPNPDWPYLDDEGRLGHYLTTTGDPPACGSCDSDEGDFECVIDGCGAGQDCCLPKDIKEQGAGFLIADSPGPFQVLRPDLPYMQFDGLFSPEGGSEPAYNLSTFLGTEYKNDRDVTFITALDGPGVQDVWMTGYLDGACDIDEEPPIIIDSYPQDHEPGESCGGKVSYLGGHDYRGKTGQRLFLNALFEADCMTAAGQPYVQTELDGDFLWMDGDVIVAAESLPVDRSFSIGYDNGGASPALDAVLTAAFEGSGLEIIDAGDADVSPGAASWQLGSVSGVVAQPDDPPSSGQQPMRVRFEEFGDVPLSIELAYRVGVSTHEAPPGDYTVRVLADGDGDGLPDELDPHPEDPDRCGDSSGNGCDDCWTGDYDPDNDLCEGGGGGGGGDGGGGAGGAGGEGNTGCGCQAGSGPSTALVAALLLLWLLPRRRRVR